MNAPTHHPEPDELIAYAAGTSPEWVSLVVACHLTYCAECRDNVSLFEDLGGALLDSIDDATGAPPRPNLDVARVPPASVSAAEPRAQVAGIPSPLSDYFQDSPPRWRFLIPGLRHLPLNFSVGGIPARVIRFKPGFTIPEHRHEALEMLLVLDGELEDGVTHELFRTGDLSRREPGTTHSQHILGTEPCTCLVVSAGPVTPSSWLGRILKAVTGV